MGVLQAKRQIRVFRKLGVGGSLRRPVACDRKGEVRTRQQAGGRHKTQESHSWVGRVQGPGHRVALGAGAESF